MVPTVAGSRAATHEKFLLTMLVNWRFFQVHANASRKESRACHSGHLPAWCGDSLAPPEQENAASRIGFLPTQRHPAKIENAQNRL